MRNPVLAPIRTLCVVRLNRASRDLEHKLENICESEIGRAKASSRAALDGPQYIAASRVNQQTLSTV